MRVGLRVPVIGDWREPSVPGNGGSGGAAGRGGVAFAPLCRGFSWVFFFSGGKWLSRAVQRMFVALGDWSLWSEGVSPEFSGTLPLFDYLSICVTAAVNTISPFYYNRIILHREQLFAGKRHACPAWSPARGGSREEAGRWRDPRDETPLDFQLGLAQERGARVLCIQRGQLCW